MIRAAENAAETNRLSLAELQRIVAGEGYSVRSFHVEGVVCAASHERKMIVLQDGSAAILLELPDLENPVRIGDRLAIDGNDCGLLRNGFAIRFGTELINNDGEHPATVKSSQVFLEAGHQPIRVEWFNASGPAALGLQYEGPGIERQIIPKTALYCQSSGQTDFQPGLHFAAYIQQGIQPHGIQAAGWHALPDFARLKPVAVGVATNLNVRYRTRDEYAALVFIGYISIPTTGTYTFYLNSDDGSKLYIGDWPARCKTTLLGGKSAPAIRSWEQALNAPAFQWSELTGTVTFAGASDEGTELELSTGSGSVQVIVPGAPSDGPPRLLHQRIEATGICEASPDGGALMIVPGWEQIEVPNDAPVVSTNIVLTSTIQVRRLNPEQARNHIPAKIQGVIIAAETYSLVLQDSSGGVYVHWNSGDIVNRPRIGELWEIEGTTDPGDFAPVVFASKAKFLKRVMLPEPIRPTWDQLMNGSLDAEYVELRGIVAAVSSRRMTLLTADGEVKIEGNESERPLVQLPAAISNSAAGSLVRLRGCFTAVWDWNTRRVIGGRFFLYPATAEVEEPCPPDPFSISTTPTMDLLMFNSRASALQRTKVAGQILYARQGEYFVLDGKTGIRILPAESEQLHPGDLIEAVGFPKLGGPSPLLLEARVCKTGHELLPEPVRISESDVLDRSHDSTWVELDATLIHDTIHGDERVLELQSGAQRFAAVLKSYPKTRTIYSPETRLRLTGVYASEEPELGGAALYPFEILLNNGLGLVVLQRPPWWTVRRAIAVSTILAGVLLAAFVWITLLRRKVEQRTAQWQKEIEARQMVEQHRAIEQERTRVARDLHDELGAGLTELGILGELGNNPVIPAEEKGNYLQQLAALTRTLVTGLDEIVWAINPHYDSVASLATYFSFFADRFLKLAGIPCRLQMSEQFPECPLNSQIRHGIFLAFKEALNNIVRHSGASEVELKMETLDHELMISIHDNGRGVVLDGETLTGDGLVGMRQRVQQLRGSCRITSRPGEGTTVEFRLPLDSGKAANVKKS
jgi:signal transduction histidine kinase